MSVGVLEAIALAFAEPAANAKLMEGVEAARRGRVQGTLLSVESGGQAIGALSGGLLFSFGPGVPFYAGSGLGFAGAGLALLVFISARRSQLLDAETRSPASADLT
jgi:MFS family permease